MSDNVIIFMLGGSLLLGVASLAAFLWGLKNNQFDDHKGPMNAVFFDSEDDLNDAAKREKKRQSYKVDKESTSS